ncbi:amino acid adenylation domain protein [Crinalium epipsammum PCC 9333]|uniref:Amino acid adenylation domain protein n=1 Tax=Crinalium epipsammum PCC 9333 TaxID=1173022 RepID=K9VTJ6_9CYAN|nr:non-ribosomal peptide synthetase [Crinalium epipsammum]AFZ11266.1 amino acid adenylation domain protein [Crinalium epipsammum PCC 9333]
MISSLETPTDINNLIDAEEVFVLPVSFSQQRLWFLDQLESGNAFYNQSNAVKLTGKVDVVALEKSFNALVERHEILRTTFVKVDDQPMQVIRPNLTLPMSVIDLRGVVEIDSEVERLAVEHARYIFDLTKAPLLKTTLLQVGDEEYVLLITMQHIISDGWSKGIFIKEIAAFYKAFSTGKPAFLPELSIQYADYALWQRDRIKGELLEKHLNYWKNQLQDATPLLELPTDRPRPPIQTYQGAVETLALPKTLTDALKNLSRQKNVTLFMTLIAAFKTLLYRYTGQYDILVGSPIANRQRAELEQLIGLFVNTLVLRTDLSENPSFDELLRRVQQVALDAYAHQDLPFEKLVEELQPERNLSYAPLFQVMFVLHNAPMPPLQLPGLKLEILDIDSKVAQFDLTLHLFDKPEGLTGWFEYSTDLFDRATIQRLIGHFETLLAGIVNNSEQKVSELPILTAAEQQQLLFEWNNTQTDYPLNQCLHELIEAQVEKTPDDIAVVFQNQELTYQELNHRANQLAHYLQKVGVKPETLVGVCMERSLELVIALLGILKAGGAYVPLDPSYPSERLAFMLEDAEFSVILSQQKLVETFPETSLHEDKPQIFCLDTGWQILAQESINNPISNIKPDNLAYVIYTSGSTGKPKGAMNTHKGICNRLLWMQDTYQLTTADRVLQKTPFSFDVSVWEFFLPLLTGARLVVSKPEGHKDRDYLVDAIAQYQITTLHFVPSMLQKFLEAESLDKCQSLQQVMCSGEALPYELQQHFFTKLPKVKLHNLYGPTEAAIDVTFWECQSNSELKIVPIGRPIANTQLYILDSYLQPVPIGIPGELHIGGVGVARGYLNRPELTKEKFIPNLFLTSTLQGEGVGGLGSNLYKTGDLVRYLPDGNIEYLGRIDNQVKIRGFRIELGEIETVLTEHPAVKQSIVITREDRTGTKQLVAYIVFLNRRCEQINADDADVKEDFADLCKKFNVDEFLVNFELDLRRYLKEKLPEYMIPTAFVVLESLPLTHNGKIDRKALPAPNYNREELASNFVAPQTQEEKLLAEIWAQVLGLEKVGVRDNFFALGGDSIRSIQVQSLAQKQGFSFSLHQLFQYQTIYELVQQLQPTTADTTTNLVAAFSLISESDRKKIPENIEDAYPLARLQAGMLFHSQYSEESATYHDIFSFYLKAPFDAEILQEAIENIVNRHPVLRTSFDLKSFSEPLQLVHQTANLALQVEDLQHLSASEQSEKINAWLEAEKQQHFDLSQPGLLRFQIHLRSAKTFQISVSFHHVILDGWSVAAMLTELFQDYLSVEAGYIASLQPELLSKFRDFVVLEREAIASPSYQDYWQTKLSDRNIAKLPRWHSSQRSEIREIRSQQVVISSEICEGIKQLTKSAAVPLKSVLLTAHLRVLSILSGQSDIISGLVVNGRPEQTDGEKVLGMFLNTLPFRLQLTGGTWTELVQQVFAAESELLPYRCYPLAELQKYSGGQPLFEAAFNFVNFHVYQGLQDFPEIEVLDARVFEATDIPLFTDFSVDPFSQQVKIILQYDAQEFCVEQIDAIALYYLRCLEAMAKEPQERYEVRSLLSEQEQHQLLIEWNNTKKDYPQDQCIHQLFEAQVERTPDAVAVVFEGQQLTYRQLNEKANQLAHYLQKLGVKPEVSVGICVERSLEMLVGILGIVKAGGAYLPLDPAYPDQRLAFMLADAQVSILLTQQSVETLYATSLQEKRVVYLDTDWQLISQESQKNPETTVKPENLVYVIYTSGSTGQSKGVAVQHSNLVNAYFAWEEAYQLHQVTSHLQMASFSFDVFSGDMVRALCSGGKLVLCPRDLLLTPHQLYELMQREKIDCAEFVPVVLRNLIQYLEDTSNSLEFMRLLICGSDSWYGSEYQKFRQFCGSQTRLINSFGVTEATIDSAYFESADTNSLPLLRGGLGRGSTQQLVPIGKPFANTQLYILDNYLQPVPVGVYGELYIGGAGVTRGYLNRPELTADKFINNPFNLAEKLYKTGDIARYLPDGNIEFIGRSDDQVKIRGFRIELAEIEAVLSQHPEVQQAVITVREAQPNQKSLVGYFVSNVETLSATPLPNTKSIDLRSFLQERLPEYMVPAAFVELVELPLTPNGKVDRKSLPAPDSTNSNLATDFTSARNTVEEQLANIWADVLRLTQVGIYDNFFELGGDSILSIQIIAKANQAGLNLTPKLLFQYPTIAELAAAAGTNQIIHTEQTPVTGNVPLTPIQNWFFEENFVDAHHWNQAVLLEVKQPLKSAILEKATQQLLIHHDALRLRFVKGESGWQQFNAEPNHIIPLIVKDLSALSSTEQLLEMEAVADELQASLDLTAGKIVRFGLFNLGITSRLLIVIHHLAVDGVSWRILIEDLQTAYAQLEQGKTVQLPRKTTSFKYWSERLSKYARSLSIQPELNYWLEQAKQPVSRMPLDWVDGVNTVATSHTLSVSLSVEETQLLLQEVPKLYRTQINDVLLTALLQVFNHWTGQTSLLIDLEGHGREELFDDIDISRTIGWFTSVFPVRLHTEQLTNSVETLKSVKEQLRSIPNRGIGYGLLRYLNSDRLQLAKLPQAEISFNYLGQFDQTFTESTLFDLAKESAGASQSKREHRTYLLEINGLVTGGQVQFDWTYSEAVHHRSTIESLAQSFIEALKSLINQSQLKDAIAYTPSDFSEFEWSQWNQSDIDDILTAIGEV